VGKVSSCEAGIVTRRVVLRSARLALTSWLATDVDDLQLVHGDAETMRHVRDGRPETREETSALIREYMAEDDRSGVTKWRLADACDQLVGRAGFALLNDGREIGYTLRRDLWGSGLATEIAGALVAWHLVDAPGVPLLACVAVENRASVRVLEKTGFVWRHTADHHGEPCEMYAFPIAHGSGLAL
jgi:[ribosomal protein S5]-alanine N-acetyltransferase